MKVVLLLAIVIIIALVVYTKRKPFASSKTSGKTPLNASTSTQYKCVVIETGLIACKQAKAMKDKKILRDQAPVLPLSDCHLGQCDCKFVRYDDRRTDDRRNESYVARSVYVDSQDKRAHSERRKKT